MVSRKWGCPERGSRMVSSLYLGAAQFVRTIQEIEPKASVLSGFQQPMSRRSMIERVASLGRPKTVVSEVNPMNVSTRHFILALLTP